MTHPEATTDSATLDTRSLTDLEAVIERGLQTFVEVGAALMSIRERKLYRETHDTFDAYCKDRWGWTATRAYRLMQASEVVETLPIGSTPANEAQARELVKVPEAERAEVMQEASTNGKPTAEKIREAATRRREPEPTQPAEPEPDDHEPDPIAEWERAEKEVSRLSALVDSLEADDSGREIRALSARCAGLEGRLQQAISTQNEAVRTAKYAQGQLRKIRDELNVTSDREILEAIRDLKR